MISFRIRLYNTAELKAQMKELPVAVQKRVIRAMARAGAGVVRKQFKTNLRKFRRTKNLEQAVGIKVSVYKGIAVGMAGIRKDKSGHDAYGNPVVPKNYNHLLERGRKAFLRRFYKRGWIKNAKGKMVRGGGVLFRDGKPRYIPAASGKFPLETAIQASKQGVRAKMVEVFQKQLAKEVEKLNKSKAVGV